MTTTQKTPTLLDALAAFQAEMPHVGKDKTADTGKYRYKYADLAAVSDAATPLLLKQGLVHTCKTRRCEDGAYEIVGLLRHTPSGEYDEAALPLFGRTAQEIGGSITYGRRYLLGIQTGIVTDEDTDAAKGSNQRASQPSAMQLAQERVQQSFAAFTGTAATFQAMNDAYVSDFDKPLTSASPDDLNRWADDLDQRRATQGAQQAVQGAQRALGAEPVAQ